MVVSTVEAGPVASQHRIELAPNCSLTPASSRTLVGSLALVTLGTALVFAWQGFWPVLPFAGLEIGLLWWAVRASMRDGGRREVIVISDDAVLIERRAPGNTSRLVFARHWATVKLRDPPAAQYPSRLVIESHGRACEVGRFLTEDERRGLAARLRPLVGRSSESPALDVRSDRPEAARVWQSPRR
ncbi:MAG TPA: DUF2244 domain-containing protein [Steroidobacteraceae bacterium]|nr:DUF2244 domain-containing protein [Steroidobacteraceae bacterium]